MKFFFISTVHRVILKWKKFYCRQSKREYEEEQKKKKTQEEATEKKEMESLIQISQVEHSRLEEEKTKEKAKLDEVRTARWDLNYHLISRFYEDLY